MRNERGGTKKVTLNLDRLMTVALTEMKKVESEPGCFGEGMGLRNLWNI